MSAQQAHTQVRLRVAHVVESTLTGVGRHVTDIVGQLMAQDAAEVHLLHSLQRTDASYLARLQDIRPAPHVYEIPMAHAIRPLDDSIAVLRLIAYLRRHGPFDVVHLHSSKAAALGGVAARLSGGRHILFTPNAYASAGETGLRHQAYLALERLCGRLAHTVIAVSQAEREYAVRHRLAHPQQLQLVPNSVPLPDIAAHPQQRACLRAEWQVSPQTRLIGSVGRLSSQKDPLLFVEIAAQRARTMPLEDEKFVLVGTGDLFDAVQAAIRRHGLQQRVLLAGFRTDMAAVYASLDVYMLHSRYEGMPYSVLEALSHGLPVIAPDVPGISELLSAPDLIVPVGAVDAFVQALATLEDPEQRRSIGQQNRQRIEAHLSLSAMVERLLQVYTHQKGDHH